MRDPFRRRLVLGYFVFVFLTGVTFVALFELSRLKPQRNRVIAALLIVLLASGLDLWLTATLYIEIHDLLHVVAVSAVLVVATSLKHRLEGGSTRIPYYFGAIVLGGVLLLTTIDLYNPKWRSISYTRGRIATRTTKILKQSLGFSRLKRPTIHVQSAEGDEPLGTCRDKTTESARGLYPARGDAALQGGSVNLVLLITIDTFRQDAFVPEVMPNLIMAARRGMIFTRAYSPGTGTDMSLHLLHQTMDGAPWTAARLDKFGVVTTAIVGCAGLNADNYGFPIIFEPNGADVVTDMAIDRIQTVGREPHFVWLHYMDAHNEYFLPDAPLPKTDLPFPPMYLMAAHFLDRELGRLFALLQEQERFEEAMIIISADHGEAFGEHGIMHHNHSSIEEVMRVPTAIVAPGIPPGSQYQELVTIRGIVPTILGAFGLKDQAEAAECFGRSWLRLATAPSPLHRFIYVRSAKYASGRGTEGPLGILVEQRYKLVYSFDDERVLLYDLSMKPREQREIGDIHKDIIANMHRSLEEYCRLGGC